MNAAPDLSQRLTELLRRDRGRLLSALIASLGNFQLAEDSLQDALEAAFVHWGRNGLPDHPQGWLLRVARRKAIDRIRRDNNLARKSEEVSRLSEQDSMMEDRPDIPDERLRLIFTCCHPALDEKSRVALTLRSLGGLSTAEIARAFLDRETTMGQRLSRAKKKIAGAGIPFAVPEPEDWDDRLNSVLTVIYLIFNEGYSAAEGESAVRAGLCEEAIFLARLVAQLCPSQPEIEGLLALMLLTHARHAARQNRDGVSVPTEEQDTKLWNQPMIDEGLLILDRAVARLHSGPYQIMAAISALHVQGRGKGQTDWRQILFLYDALYRLDPTPVVRLNRAVALAEAGSIQTALSEFDALCDCLAEYQPFHAAHASFLARAGQTERALAAYDRAIALCRNQQDIRFLQRQKSTLT